MKELDCLYLDEEGYKKYVEKTNQLKSDYDTISALISKIVLEGRKEDADTNYESLMVTRKNLKQTIESREKDSSQKVIISNAIFFTIFQCIIYTILFLIISKFIDNSYKIFLATNILSYIWFSLFQQIFPHHQIKELIINLSRILITN